MPAKFVTANQKFDAQAAAAAYLTPRGRRKIFRTVETEVACERLSIPFGSETLAARSWGDGPSILLIHGWSACQSDMFDFVPSILQLGMRAITLDLPAHGESSGDKTSLEYAGAAILSSASLLGKIDGVIAHSFGCTATALAVSQGLKLGKLVFVSPSESYENYARRFARGRGFDEEQTRLMLEELVASGIRLEIFSSELAVGFNFPGLVICSLDDEITPISIGRRISEVWSQAQLVAVDGLGHKKILRDTTVIKTAVDFLVGRSSTIA